MEPDDRFIGLQATVKEFWRWAYPDLRDNTMRGVLAEFLVAAALDQTETRRKVWDNYDVVTSSGVRVEVKASGYLQSWPQARLSKPVFGRVAARFWDENVNQYETEPEVRADVFVFAVQTCQDHATYDVLDVRQWEFHVVPAHLVRACGHKTIGLNWVRRQTDTIPYSELADAIEAAARANDNNPLDPRTTTPKPGVSAC